MKLSPYQSQLLIISASLLLYFLSVTYLERIRAQSDTRNVLLELANYSRISHVADDTVNSLKAYYADILDCVQLHSLPVGYEVEEFYIANSKGTFNLLQVNNTNAIKVDFEGGLKLVLRIYNKKGDVYGESTCYTTLQTSNVWYLTHNLAIYPKLNVYDISSICLICGLLLVTVLCLRNKYAYAIAYFSALFLSIEIARRSAKLTKHAGAELMNYISFVSSISLIGAVILIYKLQADVLSKHHILHTVFCELFKSGAVRLSILFVPFVQYIGVHVSYWFIWVPIVRCSVLSAVGSLIQRETLKNTGNIHFGPSGHMEKRVVSISDRELVAKTTLPTRGAVLVILNVVLTILLVVFSFKSVRGTNCTESLQNALNGTYAIEVDRVVFGTSPSEGLKTLSAEMQRKVVHVGIQQARSIKHASEWVKEVLFKIDMPKKMGFLTRAVGDNNTYVTQIDPRNVNEVMDAVDTPNIECVFIFQTSDDDVMYLQVDFEGNSVGLTNIEQSRLYHMDTKTNFIPMSLGGSLFLVLLLHIYFEMRTNSLLGGWNIFCQGKSKTKARVYILVAICILVLTYTLTCLLMTFKYKPEVTRQLSDPQFGVLLHLLRSIPIIDNLSKSTIFAIAVFLVLYVVMMLPQRYYLFTNNGEVIRRSVSTNLRHLSVLLYQISLSLISWSVVGNRICDNSVDDFNGFFETLRYNFILALNKVLARYASKYLNVYNDITTMWFYNLGLTSLLAVSYYYAQSKKQKFIPTDTFAKYKDNFEIDIVAHMDDIVGFKIFLKSLEEYKQYMHNSAKEVDYCLNFFSRFPRKVPEGVIRMHPKIQVHNYLDRIKKYMLCVMFLRMKVRNLLLKIETLEKQSMQRKPCNESRRRYINALKQKLQLTVAAIEGFKRTTEILKTGARLHQMGSAMKTGIFAGYATKGEICDEREGDDCLDRDTAELENFVLPQSRSYQTPNNGDQIKQYADIASVNYDLLSFERLSSLTEDPKYGRPNSYLTKGHDGESAEMEASAVHQRSNMSSVMDFPKGFLPLSSSGGRHTVLPISERINTPNNCSNQDVVINTTQCSLSQGDDLRISTLICGFPNYNTFQNEPRICGIVNSYAEDDTNNRGLSDVRKATKTVRSVTLPSLDTSKGETNDGGCTNIEEESGALKMTNESMSVTDETVVSNALCYDVAKAKKKHIGHHSATQVSNLGKTPELMSTPTDMNYTFIVEDNGKEASGFLLQKNASKDANLFDEHSVSKSEASVMQIKHEKVKSDNSKDGEMGIFKASIFRKWR
ncbi:uncharacterized protein BXIN_2235 [Babesia sp. Xinjiang]|uniref:uncharacterized protein n=1 Tax=Babesia sp. Xinjiang TaxID=462227 RepID=UPI000A252741|nr:uncharacterized protein BXIN_2235 [Babesia sp. Xinjiang]ORM40782.1 hypothetical protein BXIN_2235 [Babesia sp. Xinjiang]